MATRAIFPALSRAQRSSRSASRRSALSFPISALPCRASRSALFRSAAAAAAALSMESGCARALFQTRIQRRVGKACDVSAGWFEVFPFPGYPTSGAGWSGLRRSIPSPVFAAPRLRRNPSSGAGWCAVARSRQPWFHGTRRRGSKAPPRQNSAPAAPRKRAAGSSF